MEKRELRILNNVILKLEELEQTYIYLFTRLLEINIHYLNPNCLVEYVAGLDKDLANDKQVS